jgi:hypothetical protein
MKLKYVESTRSPFFNKVLMYDKNGRPTDSLDILEIQLSYGDKLYSLEEVLRYGLKANLSLPEMVAEIGALKETNAGLEARVNMLVEVVELLQSQIVALENANKI